MGTYRKDAQKTSASSSSSSSLESVVLHLALDDLSRDVLHSTELASAGGGASSSTLSSIPSSLRRDGAAGRVGRSGIPTGSEESLLSVPVDEASCLSIHAL